MHVSATYAAPFIQGKYFSPVYAHTCLSLILYAPQSWLRHSSLCWGATCEWVCAGRGDPGLWGTVSPRRQHHSYLCQKVRVVYNVYFISGELSWWQFRPNWALSDAHTVQNVYILYNVYASNLQFPFSDPWEQPGNEVRTTATVLATLYPNMACDVKCMLMSFCCTKALQSHCWHPFSFVVCVLL